MTLSETATAKLGRATQLPTPTTMTTDCKTWTPSDSSPSGAAQWDDNGQLIDDSSSQYTYDLAGRMTTTTPSGAPATSFTYDGDGNRVSQTTGVDTTQLRWDVNASLPLLADERDGIGTLHRSYLHGNDTLAIDTAGVSVLPTPRRTRIGSRKHDDHRAGRIPLRL